MATKYRSKKSTTSNLMMLHELANTIIKEQPEKSNATTVEFVKEYFQCKKKGKEFVWDPKNSNRASRHSEPTPTYYELETDATDSDSSPKKTGEINWE